MDSLLQTIETHTLVSQEVDDLERTLRDQRPHSSNIRDLTQLYTVAIIYEEEAIISIIHEYMIKQMVHGWYLEELIILQSFYHFTCRKQNRNSRNNIKDAEEGFVCQKFPPFSDLTGDQIKLLKEPYLKYLDQPYVRRYDIVELLEQKTIKKNSSCCVLV